MQGIYSLYFIRHSISILTRCRFSFLNRVIGVLFLFVGHHATAQQPAFTIFGEEQFHGIQIYDVIQDYDFNYWFATNEGIYYYDFIQYKKVECSKAKSNSAFNFEIGKDGVIYCHNLNNQVFQIKDKKCSLFYELDVDEGGADIRLIVAPDGNVIVGAKKLIVLNKKGTVQSRYNIPNSYLSSPTIFGDEVHFYVYKSILSYVNGSFKTTNLHGESDVHFESLQFFRLKGESYAYAMGTKKVYSYNPSSKEVKRIADWSAITEANYALRIYETKDGVWLAGTLPGTSFLNRNQLKNPHLKTMYADYFVSNVFEDFEGNIILATFDKGLLLIPNQQIKTLTIQTKEDPISSMYSNYKNGLVLGSSKGDLLLFSETKLDTLSTSGKRPIEQISGSEDGNLIVFDDGAIQMYNFTTKKYLELFKASLKDVVFASKNTVFVGTNIGVHRVDIDNDSKIKVEQLNDIRQRVYCMDYDKTNKKLYVATSEGFYVHTKDGKTKELLFKGNSIYPNDVYYHQNKVYLLTKGDGILIVENEKITQQIFPNVNDELQALKKIMIYNHTIYATTSNGFYQFDLNGKLLKSIHTLIGFSTKRVSDFTFHNHQLWISNSDGVQQIDVSYFQTKKQKPHIRLNQIRFDDVSYSSRKDDIDVDDFQKIQFVFSSTTLKNRETINYHYRLIGSETNWNVVDYKTNQVNYNALAPGEYTFQVKAESQGAFSEIVSFHFTIQPPFYQRMWFVVSVILLFLTIVYFIYRRQLNIQQRKSNQINELNASKLTAIQSQMNPHFIFNSLNSIQDLILKGDVEHSYSYITTFSNLVRRTLNYSEKDFIEFEQEIKLLEIYLSMEKLRFKKEFNYTIQINGISDVMIPPLLIQPFIENSLVHGLLHREGQKELIISFHLEETLVCIIEDNGIGREKSKEIKQRQRVEHESFSSNAIAKRFEILSNVFKGNFGYRYEDLYENEEAMGTKVILKIPIKYNF